MLPTLGCCGGVLWLTQDTPPTAEKPCIAMFQWEQGLNCVTWTDAKAETPILWPPHAKNWLIGKDPDAGKDWQREEKVTTEDEMAGWHYWLDGYEFEWTQGVGDGQGGLVCSDSWDRKELDMTERLNWTVLKPAGYAEDQDHFMSERNERSCLSSDERMYFYYQLLCFLYLLFFSPSDISVS